LFQRRLSGRREAPGQIAKPPFNSTVRNPNEKKDLSTNPC
jgi:hypothetical protein